ncbi:hypothetical protein AVEN_158131-1 [Araneus ventricosus]|uniref:Uncharacterized protein n=1 Tax=Araneus ventricosus TaxID=182803 RepID=A0A4Y2WLC3_ARAVE|nr:hypothetical protein AVEN_233363-1 [Araneus ventricosus]GBO37854.1 hypothetical protein AVEN_158131-1 [Araneus ventricosus]
MAWQDHDSRTRDKGEMWPLFDGQNDLEALRQHPRWKSSLTPIYEGGLPSWRTFRRKFRLCLEKSHESLEQSAGQKAASNSFLKARTCVYQF